MGAHGESAHGEVAHGESPLQTIAAPVTTFSYRTSRRESGPHGEGAHGETAHGDGEYFLEPEVTGAGAASIDAPVTTFDFNVLEPSLRYVINAPVTSFDFETVEPEVTGAGSVGIDAPVTSFDFNVPRQSIGFLHWAIDNTPVGPLVDETRDWQTLGLVFRVGSDVVDSVLSPLQTTAEKHETIPASDGSFTTLDRAASDGVYELRPPVGRTPPREIRDYTVGQYSDRARSQDGDTHEVDIGFVSLSNREPDGSATDETRDSDEWAFDFRSAQITTSRVEVDFSQGTDTASDTVDLRIILEPEQTKTLEESATRLSAVTVREVADGANTHDDDSTDPTDANTVAVTTPDGESPIQSGEWVVTGWNTSWLSDRAYRIDLTLGRP